jgi:hypothetical protein
MVKSASGLHRRFHNWHEPVIDKDEEKIGEIKVHAWFQGQALRREFREASVAFRLCVPGLLWIMVCKSDLSRKARSFQHSPRSPKFPFPAIS